MSENQKAHPRRAACKHTLAGIGLLSAWSSPLVQMVSLPVHARTSSVSCLREDLPGRWQFELFGPAASIRDVAFLENGTTEQGFTTAWDFIDDELIMAQGFVWLLSGSFNACDELTGTYANTIVIPPLGNIVIRRGNWVAKRLS